jgi:glycosyltransferase involved in cell wall biosynthesis
MLRASRVGDRNNGCNRRSYPRILIVWEYMLYGKRVVVVMPAYNAAKTLKRTLAEVPDGYVDIVILVDDGSTDETANLSRQLGLHTIVHDANRGYGGNQKTCYQEALLLNADIVVMVHPDYQYSPKLIVSLAAMVASGHYDVALGSRIIGGGTMHGGMPRYKYVANRLLTLIQNLCLGAKLSEYHTGFRAFSSELLRALPIHENSNDFVFDNEMIAQALYFGYRVGEISCPTRYLRDASSINFSRSVHYGFGVLAVTLKFVAARWGIARPAIFSDAGRRFPA